MKYKFFIVYCLIGGIFYPQASTLYFVAPSSLFDGSDARDDCTKPFAKLALASKALGYDVQCVDDISGLKNVAGIIFFNLPRQLTSELLNNLSKYPKEKLFLYLWEPPIHDPCGNSAVYHKFFCKVFSLWSEHVDNVRVIQHFYPQPVLEMLRDVVPFERKKLSTMIVGYKLGGYLYAERLKAIEFFEQFGNDIFEFYGAGWPARRSYKGEVKHKKNCLKNYRFCICYENSIFKGYITEKIFDCFVAGCVPVYWGAPDIEKYVPANCFIDRRLFDSLDQLYNFLKTMDRTTYEGYLDNIRKFLASDKAYYYSIDYFIDAFFTELDPHYDRTRLFSKEQIRRLTAIKKLNK